MLKLFRLNSNEYIVTRNNNKALYGDKIRAALALEHMGVDWNEIEEAFVSLQMNRHHVAEFGVNKTFIFSKALVE